MQYLKTFEAFISLNESIKIERIEPSNYKNETVTSLPYLKYIKDNREKFLKKIVWIAKDLKIDPFWLLHTIFHESRFDPKKNDRMTGSVGLLSFFPSVLRGFTDPLGRVFTKNEVLSLNNIDQLDLVYYFYKSWFEYLNLKDDIRPGDFAAITFYPGVIHQKMKWKFPELVIEKNINFFKKIDSSEKTKRSYYDYIEKVLNSRKEYEEGDHFLGDLTGAFSNPVSYDKKSSLEFYEELIANIEDPLFKLGQDYIQKQDIQATERWKQTGEDHPQSYYLDNFFNKQEF